MRAILKFSTSLILLFFLIADGTAIAQKRGGKVSEGAYIDSVAVKAMKAFDVPGIAVAVVRDGKVVHMKGYGVSSLATGAKMDENTLFAIASNSKAFTSAALAILVDEGKLEWESKVVDFIPEFRLYDPYVTHNFTIKDLLTHRSGLGLGAGDLMIWPDGSDFKLNDIIFNMRYLKPVSAFRTKYDYDNLLYIIAGEVVARASGISWEEFVESRIMRPLGMSRSAGGHGRFPENSNIIDAHVPVDGKVQVVQMNLADMANAAGGIFSSVNDMSKWAMAQLNGGVYTITGSNGKSGEKRLFSAKSHQEMWTPQTIIPVRGQTTYKTHFSAYALGWRVSDVNGYKMVTHTGGLSGVLTQVTLIADLNLGIIVFTNQQSGEAFTSVTNTILDKYFGVKGRDRVAENLERLNKAREYAANVTGDIWSTVEKAHAGATAGFLASFEGTFRDSWLGEVKIYSENGKLRFRSVRSPKLAGEMLFYKGSTFVVKWDDRSFDADSFANFSYDFEGKPSGFIMKAISPLTDFSYDFHDLDFRRTKNGKD